MCRLAVCLFALAVTIALVTQVAARKEITCLTFDKGFDALFGVWTEVVWENRNVFRYGSGPGFGLSGGGAYFTGGHINIPRFKSAYDSWSQFSISMWFKPRWDMHMVLLNTEMCGDRPALKIVYFRGHAIQADLFLNTDWSSLHGRTTLREEKSQQWNHLVMSWDGQMIRLYLNGTEVDKDELPANGDRMYNSRCDLTIGTRPPHATPVLSTFHGYLDQVCFYRVGLNASEVTFLYNNPSTTRLP